MKQFIEITFYDVSSIDNGFKDDYLFDIVIMSCIVQKTHIYTNKILNWN